MFGRLSLRRVWRRRRNRHGLFGVEAPPLLGLRERHAGPAARDDREAGRGAGTGGPVRAAGLRAALRAAGRRRDGDRAAAARERNRHRRRAQPLRDGDGRDRPGPHLQWALRAGTRRERARLDARRLRRTRAQAARAPARNRRGGAPRDPRRPQGSHALRGPVLSRQFPRAAGHAAARARRDPDLDRRAARPDGAARGRDRAGRDGPSDVVDRLGGRANPAGSPGRSREGRAQARRRRSQPLAVDRGQSRRSAGDRGRAEPRSRSTPASSSTSRSSKRTASAARRGGCSRP